MSQHKVGYVHYNGTILADALKSDNSGQTVTLYEKTSVGVYYVVTWDKTGEFEILVDGYGKKEDAVKAYIKAAFDA